MPAGRRGRRGYSSNRFVQLTVGLLLQVAAMEHKPPLTLLLAGGIGPCLRLHGKLGRGVGHSPSSSIQHTEHAHHGSMWQSVVEAVSEVLRMQRLGAHASRHSAVCGMTHSLRRASSC